jgi:translation initiation factor IF-3
MSRKYTEKKKYLINENIKKTSIHNVRIVGDEIESKVCSIDDALSISKNKNLDLVLISEKAENPVCKIVDYNKFIYEQEKKESIIKSKSPKGFKDIKFKPMIDKGDLDFKARNCETILKQGFSLNLFMIFNNKTIQFKTTGIEKMNYIISKLNEIGNIESPLKDDGKKVWIKIVPNKKKMKTSNTLT